MKDNKKATVISILILLVNSIFRILYAFLAHAELLAHAEQTYFFSLIAETVFNLIFLLIITFAVTNYSKKMIISAYGFNIIYSMILLIVRGNKPLYILLQTSENIFYSLAFIMIFCFLFKCIENQNSEIKPPKKVVIISAGIYVVLSILPYIAGFSDIMDMDMDIAFLIIISRVVACMPTVIFTILLVCGLLNMKKNLVLWAYVFLIIVSIFDKLAPTIVNADFFYRRDVFNMHLTLYIRDITYWWFFIVMFNFIFNKIPKIPQKEIIIYQQVANVENCKESKINNLDMLLEYKELLDTGAITQDEFEAKKKELLDS